MEPFPPSVFFPELSTYVQSYTLFFFFFFNASAQADADLRTEIINFLPPPDILFIFFSVLLTVVLSIIQCVFLHPFFS